MSGHARLISFPAVFAFCATVMFAGMAQAADMIRYISTAGNNSSTCTLAAPCRTLQRGINKTPAGGVSRGNGRGLTVLTGGTARVSNSSFTNNSVGMISQGTLLTRRNNTVSGNTTEPQARSRRWTGYEPFAPNIVGWLDSADHTRERPGEQGLAGVEASVWNAFFLPKGTPEPIVRRLNKAMSDTLDVPAVRTRLEELGLEIATPEQRSPGYLAKFLPEEIARWAKPIQAAGIAGN